MQGYHGQGSCLRQAAKPSPINGTQSQFFDKRSGRAERSCKKTILLDMWDVKGNCAKGRSKTERLRRTEMTMVSTNRPKYEIYHAVGTGLLRCKSWSEFANHLKSNGVEVELVMRRNGSKDLKDLQGMRFKKDGYTFKASQIRRGLSYAAILSKLDSNAEKEQQRANSQAHQSQMEQPREDTRSEQ
jgi:hypothetical protein